MAGKTRISSANLSVEEILYGVTRVDQMEGRLVDVGKLEAVFCNFNSFYLYLFLMKEIFSTGLLSG